MKRYIRCAVKPYYDDSFDARMAMANDPNIRSNILESLAKDPDPRIQVRVSQNPNAPDSAKLASERFLTFHYQVMYELAGATCSMTDVENAIKYAIETNGAVYLNAETYEVDGGWETCVDYEVLINVPNDVAYSGWAIALHIDDAIESLGLCVGEGIIS